MLELPFDLRGSPGRVQVSLVVNDEPARFGCDLLDPTLPADAARGFPVCRATVQVDAEGYAAALGWVQVVRSTDDGDVFALDPLALLRGVDVPFAFFGIAPVLFDAPFRATRDDLDWTARSFLCAVPDGVMSRQVAPVAAFTWGFSLRAGAAQLHGPEPLPLTAWDEHLSLLRAGHPSWGFSPA